MGKRAIQKKLLKDHLKGVSDKSKEIASFHGFSELSDQLQIISLTHDIAKFHEKFQRYLEGKKDKIPTCRTIFLSCIYDYKRYSSCRNS